MSRILLVEDTREIAEALQDSLEAEGYGPILREAGLEINVPDTALAVPKAPGEDEGGELAAGRRAAGVAG